MTMTNDEAQSLAGKILAANNPTSADAKSLAGWVLGLAGATNNSVPIAMLQEQITDIEATLKKAHGSKDRSFLAREHLRLLEPKRHELAAAITNLGGTPALDPSIPNG